MSLPELQRQREAGEALHEIVAAMRAMAAGRVQGAQRALASARAYENVVLEGLRAAASESPLALSGQLAAHETDLVILTSEHGLCGAFNQDILAFAEQHREALARDRDVNLLVVGSRGRRRLETMGVPVTAAYPAATSVRGLRDVVKILSGALAGRYAIGVRAIDVVYSRYVSVSQQVPAAERVLPPQLALDEARSAMAPRYRRYLPFPSLVAGLIEEYLFISLYRLVAESYASEQASRMVAMDNATRNTAEFVEELRQRERRERQSEATRQVLELIAARRARARVR